MKIWVNKWEGSWLKVTHDIYLCSKNVVSFMNRQVFNIWIGLSSLGQLGAHRLLTHLRRIFGTAAGSHKPKCECVGERWPAFYTSKIAKGRNSCPHRKVSICKKGFPASEMVRFFVRAIFIDQCVCGNFVKTRNWRHRSIVYCLLDFPTFFWFDKKFFYFEMKLRFLWKCPFLHTQKFGVRID